MKLNISTIKNIVLIVLSAILLLSIRQCRINNDNSINWEGKYSYQNHVIDSLKNKEGKQVIEQKPAEFTNDKELKKLSATIFNLSKSNERLVKQVNALVSVTQKLTVVDKDIPYEPESTDDSTTTNIDTVINNKTYVDIDSVIVPPKKFSLKENNQFLIKGTVLLNKIKLDSLSFTNDVSWRFIESKKGIFSKRETKIQAINSNKYFTNTNMQSTVVRHEPNSWNKWIKPICSALATFLITYKTLNK